MKNQLTICIFCVLLIGVLAPLAFAQEEAELVKLSDYFSKYYQYADAARMNEALADDFRYFTNVRCNYKNCETGAIKADYVAGIIEERKVNPFTVSSINLTYIAPLEKGTAEGRERRVSFYCKLVTKAKGNSYKFYSVIDYYFRKIQGDWKITKIENRIID